MVQPWELKQIVLPDVGQTFLERLLAGSEVQEVCGMAAKQVAQWDFALAYGGDVEGAFPLRFAVEPQVVESVA